MLHISPGEPNKPIATIPKRWKTSIVLSTLHKLYEKYSDGKRWKSSIDYPSLIEFAPKLTQSSINDDESMKTLHRFTHRSLYLHHIHTGLCNDVNTMEIPHRLHIAKNIDMKLKLLMQNKNTCKYNARECKRTEYIHAYIKVHIVM